MPKKYIPKKEQLLRNSLLEQLEQKGMMNEHYIDLIDDYISLYRQKEKCKKDIDKNGVVIEYKNSYGGTSRKKNDSCDMMLKTNNQMLKVLEFLKIEPDENLEVGDSDEL